VIVCDGLWLVATEERPKKARSVFTVYNMIGASYYDCTVTIDKELVEH
jgi:hypothetical protein